MPERARHIIPPWGRIVAGGFLGVLILAPVAGRGADPSPGVACLSDASRAAAAVPRVPEAQRGRVTDLVSAAEAAARGGDAAACRARADEALVAAGLPRLAPILLSTTMAGENRGAAEGVPAAPSPGASAGSTPGTSSPAAQAAPAGDAPAQNAGAAAPGGEASARTPPAGSAPAPNAAAAGPGGDAPAGGNAQAGAQPAPGDWFVTARDLLGKPVVQSDNYGSELGVIHDAVVDGGEGARVTHVIIRLPGALGTTVLPAITGARDVLVPFPALRFGARFERVRLDATAERLRGAPEFHDGDVDRLRTDAAFRRSVAEFFGVQDAPLQVAAAAPARPAPQAAPAASQAPQPAPQQGGARPAAAAAPVPAQPGRAANAQHGGQVVNRVCTACHSVDASRAVRVGPPLYGVAGRQIASVNGYSYSGALRGKAAQSWDASQLDAFLKQPRSYAPGTRMTYPGITNDQDRADVVAFLQSLR
ncbi:c-type cytochrome [Roseomonas sp. CCTCC AB2023176]|uniref:c-type cytochrome n=1 Tax=Roseomonas sp. CCTCC AB2023176 TaxID=3342640 RepID=UPI0035DF144D